MTSEKIAKPFLKWAGGKTQLIAQIEKALPFEIINKKFTYIEPFEGKDSNDNFLDEINSAFLISKVKARRNIYSSPEFHYLCVPLSGPFLYNLLFISPKRIFTLIPKAKFVS